MQPSLPLQQFVDRHLAKAGIGYQASLVLNYHANRYGGRKGIAIVPSYTLPELPKSRANDQSIGQTNRAP